MRQDKTSKMSEDGVTTNDVDLHKTLYDLDRYGRRQNLVFTRQLSRFRHRRYERDRRYTRSLMDPPSSHRKYPGLQLLLYRSHGSGWSMTRGDQLGSFATIRFSFQELWTFDRRLLRGVEFLGTWPAAATTRCFDRMLDVPPGRMIESSELRNEACC